MNKEKPKQSDLLFISQVAKYLYAQYQVVRSGRAIRLWISRGYLVKDKRVYLKMLKDRMGQMYTRKEWVDKFMWEVGSR